jgi:hypothetical protein
MKPIKIEKKLFSCQGDTGFADDDNNVIYYKCDFIKQITGGIHIVPKKRCLKCKGINQQDFIKPVIKRNVESCITNGRFIGVSKCIENAIKTTSKDNAKKVVLALAETGIFSLNELEKVVTDNNLD